MEVLYHIRPYFVVILALHMVGTSNLGSWNCHGLSYVSMKFKWPLDIGQQKIPQYQSYYTFPSSGGMSIWWNVKHINKWKNSVNKPEPLISLYLLDISIISSLQVSSNILLFFYYTIIINQNLTIGYNYQIIILLLLLIMMTSISIMSIISISLSLYYH
jgi:hypothetical protein